LVQVRQLRRRDRGEQARFQLDALVHIIELHSSCTKKDCGITSVSLRGRLAQLAQVLDHHWIVLRSKERSDLGRVDCVVKVVADQLQQEPGAASPPVYVP
jgi:hypothetical protein